MFSKIYVFSHTYYLHIYVCVYKYIQIYTHKSFSTTFDEGLRKNKNKKEKEIGKYKLNEMGALNMKFKK